MPDRPDDMTDADWHAATGISTARSADGKTVITWGPITDDDEEN